MKVNSTVRWLVIGLLAVLVFLSLRNCNAFLSPPRTDTVSITKVDTFFVEIRDTEYIPKVQTVTKTDSFTVYEQVQDTSAVLRQFFTKKGYKDTVYKSKYGTVIVIDTVYTNALASRKVRTNIRIPGPITKTIRLRDTVEVDRKRLAVYVGVEGMAWPVGIGALVGLKLPSGTIFSAKAIIFNGKPVYGGQIQIPIKLRK